MNDIIKNYNLLFNLNEVHEIRILKTPQGTVSGYFNNPESIAEAIRKYYGQYNIFMTLNPVHKKLDGIELNTLYSYSKKVTKDNEISRISYLFIDIDPKRLPDTSSTDEEFNHALEMSNRIEAFLGENGFGQSYKLKSGNGVHLLYKFAENTPIEITKLNRKILQILNQLFSNQYAEVDKTTYNASRLTKVYGTFACKGENTEERPHRKSDILYGPDNDKMIELTTTILENFINKYEIKPEEAKSLVQQNIDLKQFLNKYGYKIKTEHDFHGVGTMYKFYECPFNAEHKDNSAYAIQFHKGPIMIGCHHNSCSEYGWKTLYHKHSEFTNKKKKASSEQDKLSVADELVHMILNQHKLCTNESQEGFIIIEHVEFVSTVKLSSTEFKRYLMSEYFKINRKTVPSDSLKQAIDMLEAEAYFSGKKIKLEMRINKYQNDFYYDLGGEKWKSVCISDGYCEIVNRTPAIFYRNNLMKEQVMPNLEVDNEIIIPLLKKHFRFKTEDDSILYAIYIISCLVPDISHPILLIHGEKGSAKSTTMRLTRDLIDPSSVPLTTLPRNKEDLAINFSKNYMPSFDNLRGFTHEMSDLLCMGVTGGAITKRKLYSDTDETVISFKRCIQMNGINVVATQADLLDRCLLLELSRIGETHYKSEEEVFEEFELDKPELLGAMFNILSQAKKLYRAKALSKVFRLTDFTYWGYAIAEAMGVGGERLIKILDKKKQNANLEALDSNIVASTLLLLLKNRAEYRGGIAQLLDLLKRVAFENGISITSRNFPSVPRMLSVRLKEIKSNLEEAGITYEIKNVGTHKEITILNSNVREEDTINSSTDFCGCPITNNVDIQGLFSPMDVNNIDEDSFGDF